MRNNLFVSEGGGGYAFKNPTAGLLLDHNVFHGIDLARPNPGGSTADPLLRADFRLAQGSPALASGAVVADNGGRDYFGNPVSPTAAPNIGAYAGCGLNSLTWGRTCGPSWR